MKNLTFRILTILCLMLGFTSQVWAEEVVTTLFHESFGDNSGSARAWDDSYSVKSGISNVYSGITGYTITNAKQGKNTTGSTASGLNQTTSGTDASIIIGPLNVSNYNALSLSYQWKAGSIKGTYTAKAYYATSSTGNYTEVSGTGNGASTFVERKYNLPQAAEISTLYLKIVFNTSNTQAIIDEIDLKGTSSTPAATLTSISISGVPTKTIYTEGEEFDPAGLVVTGTYSNKTTATITNGITWYKEPLSLGTTTFDTYATVDKIESDIYTVNGLTVNAIPTLSTIDQLFEAASAAGNTSVTKKIAFNNWIVSGVKGSNAYVTDGTKGFIIYQSSHGFSVGDILSGTATCEILLYNGSAEIKGLTAGAAGLTITKGGPLSAQKIDLQNLSGINTGALLSFSNLTYNEAKKVFSDGVYEIKPYNGLISTLPTLTDGTKYNVTGVYVQYGETKEILPRSEEDIINPSTFTSYIVTLDDGTKLTSNNGKAVVLPSRDAVGDFSFCGWSTSEVSSETTIAPELIEPGDYIPSNDVNLYPVYSRTSSTTPVSAEASVNIEEYASSNNWSGNGAYAYKSITLDDQISVSTTGGGNSGKYYSDWRLYQSDKANIIITATNNATLDKAVITYDISNTGQLYFDSKKINSNEEVTLSGCSATFTVGNSANATNGQVRVTDIKVTYHTGGTNTVYYTSKPAVLKSISISGQPNKKEYTEGEEFDPSGLVVTGTYSDGTTKTITSGINWYIDKLTEGATSFETYVYVGSIESETYIVSGLTVSKQKTLSSIVISGTPNKTTYVAGETLNPTGLIITGQYSDGSSSPITEGIDWIFNPETLAAGNKTCDVLAGVGNISSEIYQVSGLTVYPGYSNFTATSGKIDDYISYEAYKGDGTSDPIINNGNLRLYQGGSYLTLSGKKGIKIQKVIIGTSSTYPTTTIGYCVGDEDAPTSGVEVSKESTYTIENLNNNIVYIYCLGSTKDTRLEIASIAVIYTKEDISIRELTISGEYKTEFNQYETFSHSGLVVNANYTDGSTEIVTDKVDFSDVEMSIAGEQTVTISYNGHNVSYTINVIEKSSYFYETFGNNDKIQGGNDGNFGAGSGTASYDNDGWICGDGTGGANQCIKLGTSSAAGYAKTPAINFTGNAKLTFRAAGWNGDTNLGLTISVSNGYVTLNPAIPGSTSSVNVTMESAKWNNYEVYISDVNEPIKITIAASLASKNRFFLDDVKVEKYEFSPIASCNLVGAPINAQYEVGDRFDPTGINLQATLDNGKTVNLTEVIWSYNPSVFTNEGEQQVEVTATYNSLSFTQSYNVKVNKKNTSISISDAVLALNEEWTIEPQTIPNDIALNYEIIEGSEFISIEGNTITANKVGTAEVKASFVGNDEYATAEITFKVVVSEEATLIAIKEYFEATDNEGAHNFTNNTDVSFEAFKGNAATPPAAIQTSSTSGEYYLRLYQNGGYVTISGAAGVRIRSIKITTGKSYITTVGYCTDDKPALTSGQEVQKSSSYTIGGLNNRTVSLYCLGTTKDNRLDIASIEVKYSKENVTLEEIAISNDYKTDFYEGDEFTFGEAKITATFSNGDIEDITRKVSVSNPNMSLAGDQLVNISYTYESVTKEIGYSIHVTKEEITELQIGGEYQSTFKTGETFNHEGITITAIYNSGKEKDVTSDAVYSTPSMTTIGTKSIFVSYEDITTEYSIKVVSSKILFFESFDKNSSTGGNDGKWDGSVATGTLVFDNEGWIVSNGKGADKCAKFGTGSNPGKATTPNIQLSGNALLSFRAAAWNSSSENTKLILSASSGKLSESSIELVKGEWSEYIISISGVTESTAITFAAENNSTNRFFIDEVMVIQTEAIALTSSARLQGWKTFYNETKHYIVDNATTIYTAIQMGSEAILVRPTGNNFIPAGTPVLLKTTAPDYTINLMEIEETDKIDGENILQVASGGETGVYILACSNTKPVAFYRYNDPLDPSDVYIPAPAGAASLRIVIEGISEEETGIDQICETTEEDTIFNLSGIRIQKAKGLVIKNGKVMLVK